MASAFEYEQDAIHIKAYSLSSNSKEDVHRKFSVDPNLTTYEILRTILSRAFDIKEDNFRLNYFSADQQRLPLLSDWDLDSAIISASDPFLQLEIIEHRPSTSSDNYSFDLDESDINSIEGPREKNSNLSSAGLLPSPETIQSFVTTSNQAGTSFILKHVNHTLPALTKRIHKAFTLQEECGGGPSPLRSPTKSPSSSPVKSCRAALSDKEFRSFLDNVGELVSPRELRLVIYQGGIEPQLRKVVWKHLLGVYPSGLNGRERLEYMRQKSSEYDQLKGTWTEIFEKGKINSNTSSSDGSGIEELKRITNMVRKDVLRTDRQHKFYAGEGNENVTALFNILTTYSLNHPSVAYCQGMSDLLSPILMTMMDESHAYVCFCALMQRLKINFFIDGISMTKKFQHLTDGLLYYDPEFFTYLKLNQADDLLFCYRWLLLEMKREFDFDDCFKVLETLWSSLPPNFPTKTDGLKLFELRFTLIEPEQMTKVPISNSKASNIANLKSTILTTRKPETVYSKVANLRRQTSSASISTPSRFTAIKGRRSLHLNTSDKEQRPLRIRSTGSTESDTSTKRPTMSVSGRSEDVGRSTKPVAKSNSWGNNNACVNKPIKRTQNELPPNIQPVKKITDLKDFSRLTTKGSTARPCSSQMYGKGNGNKPKPKSSESDTETNIEAEHLVSEDEDVSDDEEYQNDVIDDEDVVGYSHFNAVSRAKVNGANQIRGTQSGMPSNSSTVAGLTLVCEKLPEPTEFGDGNPFLIFLCIACLLQHRTHIMQQQFDYQEIAMYFDRMVRRHNVEKTLGIARKLFAEYLNGDWSVNSESNSQKNKSLDEPPKHVNNVNRDNDKC